MNLGISVDSSLGTFTSCFYELKVVSYIDCRSCYWNIGSASHSGCLLIDYIRYTKASQSSQKYSELWGVPVARIFTPWHLSPTSIQQLWFCRVSGDLASRRCLGARVTEIRRSIGDWRKFKTPTWKQAHLSSYLLVKKVLVCDIFNTSKAECTVRTHMNTEDKTCMRWLYLYGKLCSTSAANDGVRPRRMLTNRSCTFERQEPMFCTC